MMDVVKRQEALTVLSERLREIAPPTCVQVYGGFQAPRDGELHGAILGAVAQDGQWGFGQFDQDPVVYDLVQAFYDVCVDEPWTTFEIKVDYTGEFNVTLGHDPLPAGAEMAPVLLERLQGYNATFVEEYGATPRG